MGHFSYLNGQVSQGGSWLYFPEAIAIKSPLAMLIGLLLTGILVATMPRRIAQRALCLAIPAFVFLGFSMTSKINIGVRHVLPVIPFLYLLIALWLARRGWRAIVLVVLIALAFVETFAVHADYIAFFNTFVGGPRNGEKYLLDSNLDWGQDQARLKAWLESNARGRTVTTRLFGNQRLYEWPHEGFDLAPENAPPTGLFAISKNYEYDVYPNPQPMSWIRNLKPIARIGHSIDVFDLKPADLPPGPSSSGWRSDQTPE
jgi:hypothetical protein